MNKTLVLCHSDDQIVQWFTDEFSSQYNLINVTNRTEFLRQLTENDVAIAMCGDAVNNDLSLKMLQEVKETIPTVRRVLVTKTLNEDEMIRSINESGVHKIFLFPLERKKTSEALTELVTDYDENLRNTLDYAQTVSTLLQKRSLVSPSTDEILNILMNVSRSDIFSDFTNQFIIAVRGLFSLVAINVELYLDSGNDEFLDNAFNHLSDIEVFANQYDQIILLMHINTLRSYLFIQAEEYEEAMEAYKGSISLFHWLSSEFIESKLIDIVKNFPLFEDQIYAHTALGTPITFSLDQAVFIKEAIQTLVYFDTSKIISISETLFRHFKGATEIQYFIIVRNELPIFDYKLTQQDFEVNLVSAFVVALSNFIREVVRGSGDIETIDHDNGTIMFHRANNLVYILLTTGNDARYRIGLRQFAHEAIDLIDDIEEGYHLSGGEHETDIGTMFERIFNIDREEIKRSQEQEGVDHVLDE